MSRRLYLYTADITSKFLDKFDMPSKYFDAGHLDISYTRLPVNNAEVFAGAVEAKMFSGV